MQILLNGEREITNYAIVGGFEDGIEIDNIPDNFIVNFKPRYYLFEDNEIIVNKDYKEDTDEIYEQPEIDLDENTKGLDKELRNMFASMQIQIVQGNMMVSQFSEQNAKLAQELVRLQKELEDMKGDK